MVSLAQLVERQIVALVVTGSSPVAHPFQWPHRLTVRTSLFQGENTGSIPVGVTKLFGERGITINLNWSPNEVK